MRLADLTGHIFGRLEVLRRAQNKEGPTAWLVKCSCGAEKPVRAKHLLSGAVVSCGCLRAERREKHGMAGTRQYKIWSGMMARCTNASRKEYDQYGGRGISVCDAWKTFDGFWSDMGPTYLDGLSLDRINNNGNYEPGNCRWATQVQQARNTSRNRLVELDGQLMSVAEAAERTGVNRFALRERVEKGMTGDALFARRIAGGRKKKGEAQRPILDPRATAAEAVARAVIGGAR